MLSQKCSALNKFSHKRFHKQKLTEAKLPAIIEELVPDSARSRCTFNNTQLPKKKKKTLKVTKLTSCMNFRTIQALIKCFERSTVERIEENLNDVSRCLFIR